MIKGRNINTHTPNKHKRHAHQTNEKKEKKKRKMAGFQRKIFKMNKNSCESNRKILQIKSDTRYIFTLNTPRMVPENDCDCCRIIKSNTHIYHK